MSAQLIKCRPNSKNVGPISMIIIISILSTARVFNDLYRFKISHKCTLEAVFGEKIVKSSQYRIIFVYFYFSPNDLKIWDKVDLNAIKMFCLSRKALGKKINTKYSAPGVAWSLKFDIVFSFLPISRER